MRQLSLEDPLGRRGEGTTPTRNPIRSQVQQNTGGGQGLSGEGGLGTGGNPCTLGIRDSQSFRLESWAQRCGLVGGGGPQHPGVRREGWKGHGVMGHPQTTLRISLVSLSLCYLWFALLLLIFLSPSGKPSQSRRLILAGEGLKDARIHAKHIGLSGGTPECPTSGREDHSGVLLVVLEPEATKHQEPLSGRVRCEPSVD